MVDSKQYPIVQLSDFIAGTIATIYEGRSNPALEESFLQLLKAKGINLIEWPTKYQLYFSPDSDSNAFDQAVHTHALTKAELFLEENKNSSDEEIQWQVCTLGHLTWNSRLSADISYISTQKILDHLKYRGFDNVSTKKLRSSVIAKLRDKGVIIASSNKGYKIPRTYSDLRDFVERVNSFVTPLLERLNIARKSYLMIDQEIDLLKGSEYPHLVDFLNTLNTNRIC